MASTDEPSPAATPCTSDIVESIVIDRLHHEASMTFDAIGHDEPLFEFGMDSLVAASIISSLETQFGKQIKPEVVYELETVREIAEYLDSVPVSVGAVQAADANTAADLVSVAAATDALEAVTATPQNAFSGDNPLAFYARLNEKIHALKDQGRYLFEPEVSAHDGAWVECEGRRMLMLASYEYLGLLGDERLNQAAAETLQQFGTGHHGSRLLTGTTSLHCKLEARLAKLMNVDDAIVYTSGYVANLATIGALVGPGDYVIGDSMNHASIVDGCRMSGAEFAEFKHADMAELESRLQQRGGRRTLVVVDAIFSMEGDIIDLPAVVELCQRYHALLMVDEAHSLGVLGRSGGGIQEHFGLDSGDVHIKMGTLSKSLAGSGGFVAGDRELITYLRHHARGYIFSGALPAVYANVAIAALDVMEQEPERVSRIWENVRYFLDGLQRLGFDTGACESPIVPIMTRSNEPTMTFAQLCRQEGLLVAPVCFPAVPMNAPRLRTCVTSIHSQADLDFALDVLARTGRECGII